MFNNKYKFEHYETIDSTMNRGRELASIEQEGVILADFQTAGRGQNNKSWLSEKNKGIYATIVLKTPLSGTISLAVGLAVVEVLNKYSELPILKWPNDILIPTRDDGGFKLKKLCGILVEYLNSSYAVIGIGLNLKKSYDLSNLISLEEITQKFDKLNLLEEIVFKVEEKLRMETGELLKHYISRSIFNFGPILNKTDNANLLGISERGALIIEDLGEVFSYSIDISSLEKRLEIYF